MYMKLPLVFVLGFIATACTSVSDNKPPQAEPIHYEPTRESLRQWTTPQWLDDAVLGVYTHWGPYSVPGFVFTLEEERVDSGIWYAYGMYKMKYSDRPSDELGVAAFHLKTYGDPEDFGYHDLITLFKAEKWDPNAWAQLFKDAGCDFVGLGAEHADGYPMWDTQYDAINAKTTGPKRDLLGDMFAAARRLDLRTIATIHEPPGSQFEEAREFAPKTSHLHDPKYRDLYNADTPELYAQKVYELVEKYQPDQLWLDNALLSDRRQVWLKFVADYYNMGERWGRGGVLISQKYKVPMLLEHTVFDIEGGEFPGGRWVWRGMKEPHPKRWQKDVPIGKYWAYAEGVGCRPVNLLIDGIVDRIAKNGVTLLGLAPRADGTLPDEQVKGLMEIGEWMKINKEALYAARPAPYKQGGVDAWQAKDGTVRFTEKGAYLYAIDLGNTWPPTRGFDVYDESKKPTVPYTLPDVRPVPGSTIRMLGSDQNLQWRQDDGNLVIEQLPAPLPCDHAWVFKIRVHESDQ